MQRHINKFQNENFKHISFKLFNYDGHKIIYPQNELRTVTFSQTEICSDVFIFENSVSLPP